METRENNIEETFLYVTVCKESVYEVIRVVKSDGQTCCLCQIFRRGIGSYDCERCNLCVTLFKILSDIFLVNPRMLN